MYGSPIRGERIFKPISYRNSTREVRSVVGFTVGLVSPEKLAIHHPPVINQTLSGASCIVVLLYHV